MRWWYRDKMREVRCGPDMTETSHPKWVKVPDRRDKVYLSSGRDLHRIKYKLSVVEVKQTRR